MKNFLIKTTKPFISKNNNIVISFDFGTKNIGVAVGQYITFTSNPLTTIKNYNKMFVWIKIKKLYYDWKPNIIVVGLPLNINGTEQPITTKAREFAINLHKYFNIYVALHDERFSSVEARANLFVSGGFRAIKKQVNAKSAAIILESWLQENKNNF